MGLTLEDLAKEKPFENDSEYRKLFKELDNDKSFKSHLQITFTILRRSHAQNNVYLHNIKPLKYYFCVYYKYRFYQKLITDNIDNECINEINATWKRQKNAFSNSIHIPCKFHANTLEDVKIIKVLYDHIIFPSIREKENSLKRIDKCEYCDYLKIVYKILLFTSLGSLIHHATKSITDIWKDTQEDRSELFFRETEAENEYFQNPPISILYNMSELH
ncbi:hypothetical protein, conserved [Plasmodium ovale]|uniref:PIR protein n=1 Tax=Plasmodium ovale TaxID=36330 RepID=A0A1C3KKF0_PLAOA|nr:hypothetical protein, conserved [Plasmodium ovale]